MKLLLFLTMSEVIRLYPNTPEKKEPGVLGISQNQAYYGARVHYNIENISTSGFVYIQDLLENLFKTLIHTPEKHTHSGFYIRVENELKKCTIFELRKITELIDEYLPRPHLQQSREREFFMRIRNIAFISVQKQLYPQRYL